MPSTKPKPPAATDPTDQPARHSPRRRRVARWPLQIPRLIPKAFRWIAETPPAPAIATRNPSLVRNKSCETRPLIDLISLETETVMTRVRAGEY
jgi:hypothetical protein